MLWLGVNFPLLPLEVFTAGRNAEKEQNVESVESTEKEHAEALIDGGRVLLCNDAAAAAGIATGSTLATAHSIAPGLRHYRRSPQREQQRLQLLAEALYGFSARVSLSPAAPGGASSGVVMEIGGSLALFGDTEHLGERVRALCEGMGHEAHVRWASTPLAALILARADPGTPLASVPLPRAAIEPQRLTPDRLERLANMGIRTVGELLALPVRELAHRFGDDLVDYLARLTGDRPDPRCCITPTERFHATLHLLEPITSKQALMFPMGRLLKDLEHWLVARQLGAEQLRWHFRSSSAGSVNNTGSLDNAAPLNNAAALNNAALNVRFARAQQRQGAFLDISRLQLAEASLPEEVISLGLEARRLVPWSAGSRGLFHDHPGLESPRDELNGQDALVDQLRARLGRSACHGLEVRDQHAPEQAWSPVDPGTAKTSKPAQTPMHRRRPLWLFDAPFPVHRQQLTLLDGPERLNTGWWLVDDPAHDRPGQGRDYYVARHRSGAECWVFADPEDRWYLHGYFA